MEQKKPLKSRRKYDASFKQEVVKMIVDGRSVPDIARSLGIGENIIYRWKEQATAHPDTAAQQQAATVSLAEYLALQKRNRELEMEKEILKKALSIFSHPQ
jgi:transposase